MTLFCHFFAPFYVAYVFGDQNGVGPLGFSMTLFQGLATAAGGFSLPVIAQYLVVSPTS